MSDYDPNEIETIDEGRNRIAELTAERDALQRRVEQLEESFAHYLVGSGEQCELCGLNFRDSIHYRTDDPRLKKGGQNERIRNG